MSRQLHCYPRFACFERMSAVEWRENKIITMDAVELLLLLLCLSRKPKFWLQICVICTRDEGKWFGRLKELILITKQVTQTLISVILPIFQERRAKTDAKIIFELFSWKNSISWRISSRFLVTRRSGWYYAWLNALISCGSAVFLIYFRVKRTPGRWVNDLRQKVCLQPLRKFLNQTVEKFLFQF